MLFRSAWTSNSVLSSGSFTCTLVICMPFGDCLSKTQPYRSQNYRFALCMPFGAMPSHHTIPDYFNHRALGIRPRSLLWLAHVTGLFKTSPPTYRMMSELGRRKYRQKKPLATAIPVATLPNDPPTESIR